MRVLNTLSTVGTTVLTLGDVEFIKQGQQVIIAGVDSVETATLSVKFAGTEVFSGPLPVEQATNSIQWPNNIATSFIAGAPGQMQATLGGTVAGARVNFMVLNPGEPRPW